MQDLGLRKNSAAFKSAILKRRLSHTDKTDPKILKLPNFVNSLDDEKLYSLVGKVVKKYKDNNYRFLEREELDEDKSWSDVYILVLAEFYKRDWRYIIKEQKYYFPHFVFTYNPAPLKKELDKIVSRIYDKTDPELSKKELDDMYTYSALDITYFLHYLNISHPMYKEEDENSK